MAQSDQGSDKQPRSSEDPSRIEDARFGALSHRGGWPKLRSFPAFMFAFSTLVLAVAFALFTNSLRWPSADRSTVAAERPDASSAAQASRLTCAEIGTSDLRSPAEGLWFQESCLVAANLTPAATTACNRTVLDEAEFVRLSEGLFVFRQKTASTAYLWYSGTPDCFNLVDSERRSVASLL